MKCLITDAGGFIGSHLAELLPREGYGHYGEKKKSGKKSGTKG